MIRFVFRAALRMRVALPALALAALCATPTASVHAQYFGRNKVKYDRMRFDVLRTTHFDVHYYPEEQVAVRDAARMLERWNTRLSTLFGHTLSRRKPVILYADHPDFQQTNVIAGQLDESTGGVTESLLDRMTMPLTGSYADNDHILGHELVHVFQYDIAQQQRTGMSSLERLPLFLVEGMAEYLSVGPRDPHTAMWLRDAVRRNDLPTVRQLSNGSKYFPYRYGEALWAFIGGTWGDEVIPRLYKASLRDGFDQALLRTLGIKHDSLSKRWHAALRTQYAPLLDGRTAPRNTGALVAASSGDPGDFNVSPAISPDGRLLAYFSTRSMRGVELILADAATGARRASFIASRGGSHADALSFLYSAATWSPDGRKLAFVAFADGDNEIEIIDVASRTIERRWKPEGIGAVTSIAWSPDGGSIAFSGMRGGISDLYVFDLVSGQHRALTDDRFADLLPSWSPDGTSLAFSSDRATDGDSTTGSNFDVLRHGRLRIATIDVRTRRIHVLHTTPEGRELNPVYSPDGTSIYFVSTHGGFNDVLRLELPSGALFQVTRVASGISGITATSPAISVSQERGDLFFSVFERNGGHIASLAASLAQGEALILDVASATTDDRAPDAALLPAERSDRDGLTLVAGYLKSVDGATLGDSIALAGTYKPRFRLAAIGPISLAIGSGGVLGTQVAGNASAYFTDMLGDHSLGVAVQAAGTPRDVGGQLMYINNERRIGWGAGIHRIPYVLGYATASQAGRGTAVNYAITRLAVTGGQVLAQYARSSSTRIEAGLDYTHYGYSAETIRDVYAGNTRVSRQRVATAAPDPLSLGTATLAYVGDRSYSGFTSPVSGSRYRLQISPTAGSLNFQTLLADYRKYVYLKPFTLAVRGIHYGRYGSSADDERLGTLFLGEGTLIRGYSYGSFTNADCSASGTGALSGTGCPQFSRLVGSRIGVVNVEARLPLVGMAGLGLLQTTMLPPIELAAFADLGVAWTGSSAPTWRFGSSTDRTPVRSAGVATRVNLFGLAVFEVYYARPLERLTTSGVWGLNLAPGW